MSLGHLKIENDDDFVSFDHYYNAFYLSNGKVIVLKIFSDSELLLNVLSFCSS